MLPPPRSNADDISRLADRLGCAAQAIHDIQHIHRDIHGYCGSCQKLSPCETWQIIEEFKCHSV